MSPDDGEIAGLATTLTTASQSTKKARQLSPGGPKRFVAGTAKPFPTLPNITGWQFQASATESDVCFRLRAEQHVPRFHFNIYDGYASADEEGTVLDGYEAARRQAIALAGTVLIEVSREPRVGNEWRVEVTDERGLILYRLDIVIAKSAAISERSDAN